MTERLRQLREQLQHLTVDAVLITNPYNRFYLSGFDGSSGVLMISSEKAYLVTDFRYTEQAAAQAPLFEIVRWQDDLYNSLVPIIVNNGWQKLGFESKHVVHFSYGEMNARLPVELVPLEHTVETQRARKDQQEIATLRQGAAALDQAFEYVKSVLEPGRTEKEVALALESYLRRQGAEGVPFPFIVASGKRGAMPHGVASSKAMGRGELVTIDFGAIFFSYATDMTRTVSLGEPAERQRAVYDVVNLARQKATEAVKPGMKGSAVDAVAREIIGDAGFGEYFGHGLGHGVGLETHEQPVLNTRSETVLVPGMVVTIEPGIYIPDWGGVRIEDMILVTEQGFEILTRSPHELAVI
ncbi:MAG TPA: Xaa-Pro peptidase family protein [Candidatus Limnocylindrales bacterium]|nr:Xaa-Pro peptidase family protein [Candidatus Limnocylindrales bacterium]